MIFDFLTAADGSQLTKKYTKTDTSLQVSAYPMVRDFNSHRVDVKTLKDLNTALLEQSAKHACLVKGALNKQLINQSRAGATDANAKTDWLLLDLDFDSGFSDIDSFLYQLDPALKNVSYIFQHSSSAGIKGTPGLRGHIFIKLAEPVLPSVLKEWLKAKNFALGALNSNMELSANGMALKWPLDISTCQNDKLIYIAPPICVGFDDPMMGQRFIYVEKSDEMAKLDFTSNPAKTQDLNDDKVNELRETSGLKKRTAKYKTIANQEVLINPDKAIVTDITEARGFVYLNLNGGDSWGYFFPADNPTIVSNFKGEPPVLLKDVAPDVYEAYNQVEEVSETEIPFVFRDQPTDVYYTAIYNTHTHELDLWPVSNVQKLNHFLLNYNIAPPEVIPEWTIEFNPTVDTVIDFDKRWINRFSPSVFMRNTETPKTKFIPPTINRVITSICGNDEETQKYFLNWLAYIFQTRKKTGTAWIFHGVPGTGKGILFERILQPLFGAAYVKPVLTVNFEDQFNNYMCDTVINWMDEFQARDGANSDRIMNKLKNAITENQVLIREMRQNARQEHVYNNFIIATNHADPVPLDPNERRFNVAPAQEHKLEISIADVDKITGELPYFASYLRHYEVNEQMTRIVLKNEARNKMIAAAESSVDNFFRAIREGNFDYFLQYKKDHEGTLPDPAYIAFKDALRRWGKDLTDPQSVSRDELMNAYAYLQGAKPTPAKFSRMARIHRVEIKPVRIDGELARGYTTHFKSEHPDEVKAFLDKTSDIKKFGTKEAKTA